MPNTKWSFELALKIPVRKKKERNRKFAIRSMNSHSSFLFHPRWFIYKSKSSNLQALKLIYVETPLERVEKVILTYAQINVRLNRREKKKKTKFGESIMAAIKNCQMIFIFSHNMTKRFLSRRRLASNQVTSGKKKKKKKEKNKKKKKKPQ